jgi:hypothetical protein
VKIDEPHTIPALVYVTPDLQHLEFLLSVGGVLDRREFFHSSIDFNSIIFLFEMKLKKLAGLFQRIFRTSRAFGAAGLGKEDRSRNQQGAYIHRPDHVTSIVPSLAPVFQPLNPILTLKSGTIS